VSEIGGLGLQKLVVIAVVGFSDVLSPSLMVLLIMVVVVLVVLQYKSRKKKSNNNSRTQETSKQKKPKKLEARKNLPLSIINEHRTIFLKLN
jgi:c-di-AMP phosphodiesterase-like protein